jgi:hypothetical protein
MLLAIINCPASRSLPLISGATHESDFRRVLSCFGISHVRRPTRCFVLRAWALVWQTRPLLDRLESKRLSSGLRSPNPERHGLLELGESTSQR